jgi:HlyD family secretion protein
VRTSRKLGLALLGLAAAAAAVYLAATRRAAEPRRYTGFVEGEERIIRSEVIGRVLEVPFAEGDAVSPNAVVARLDDADMRTRVEAKRAELDVAGADIARQEAQVALSESTWVRDVNARRAELAEAESAAAFAARDYERQKKALASGGTSAQLVDDARSKNEQAEQGLVRARELLARAEAEEHGVVVARRMLESMKQRKVQTEAELANLEVTLAKYTIRAPAVATTVQTQYIWPGELAQPGTPIVSVLDPLDKYVQLYVPVPDLARFQLGQPVEIELDSRPGHRVPGVVSFVASKATFTPEKIETRAERVGQVYRAKIRILAEVETFQPGAEGNVTLLERGPGGGAAPRP